MVRSIVTAAVLALVSAGAQAGLDFTPFQSFYEVEGVRVPNLNFHDDGKVIAYTPPPRWKTSGRGRKLELIPPQAVQAGATFQVLQTAPLPADASKVSAFRELAVSMLPAEATNVEIVEAKLSELCISGRAGVAVVLSYKFFAQQFRMRVLFIPRERDLLRFAFTARTADFGALEKRFRHSLYSLEGL